MKPLTRYALCTGMNTTPTMTIWPEGPWYRAEQADAAIAELQAEVTTSKHHAAQAAEAVAAMAEQCQRLQAECERLRDDAERYRWLRADDVDDCSVCAFQTTQDGYPIGSPALWGDALDAAIDAARSGDKTSPVGEP